MNPAYRFRLVCNFVFKNRVQGCAASTSVHAFFNGTSQSRFLIGLRHYKTVSKPSRVDEDLGSFIDDLTKNGLIQEHSTTTSQASEDPLANLIHRTESIEHLQKILPNLEKKIDSEVAAGILKKLSSLAFKTNTSSSSSQWCKSCLLPVIAPVLSDENLRIDIALMSVTSLISLDATDNPLYIMLLNSIRKHLTSSLSSLQVSTLVQFAAALQTHNVKLDDDMQTLLNNSLVLKTSEIENPSDLLSLLINAHLSKEWLEKALERVKEMMPLMSTGELVALAANLSHRGCRAYDVLNLLAASLKNNSKSLTINQIVTLSHSVSTLSFQDARILRRICRDLVDNINSVQKWSSISSIAVSFAKIKLNHPAAWKSITSWINTNYEKAEPKNLSFAVSSCAMCNVGGMITPAAKFLSKNLDLMTTPTANAWLNTLYALAICQVLTPKLAETVLRREFLDQILHEVELWKKFFIVSRIAQIQAVTRYEFGSEYCGSTVDVEALWPKSDETKVAELYGVYGKKEAYDAECFHNILYKIAPIRTHAVEPEMNADGIFVDAIVKVDSKRHFVPIKNFAASPCPPLAVIYLNRRRCTLTCEEDEESRPIGSAALSLRLLKAKGIIPVVFTDSELIEKKLLTQKIEIIKKKLFAAAFPEVEAKEKAKD